MLAIHLAVLKMCNVPDDLFHILMEISQNAAIRINYKSDLNFVGQCNIILAEPMSDNAIKLSKFIHRTDTN